MFSPYNNKQCNYSFRSEQLKKFQKRLVKHTEKVVELTNEEFDFIFDGYFLWKSTFYTLIAQKVTIMLWVFSHPIQLC